MDIFKESMVPLIPELAELPHKDGLDYDGDVILTATIFIAASRLQARTA